MRVLVLPDLCSAREAGKTEVEIRTIHTLDPQPGNILLAIVARVTEVQLADPGRDLILHLVRNRVLRLGHHGEEEDQFRILNSKKLFLSSCFFCLFVVWLASKKRKQVRQGFDLGGRFAAAQAARKMKRKSGKDFIKHGPMINYTLIY